MPDATRERSIDRNDLVGHDRCREQALGGSGFTDRQRFHEEDELTRSTMNRGADRTDEAVRRRSGTAKTLGGLAHPRRLEILGIVSRAGVDGLASGEIANLAGIAPAAASHHLSRLVAADVLSGERDGRRVVYALQRNVVRDAMLELAAALTASLSKTILSDGPVPSRRVHWQRVPSRHPDGVATSRGPDLDRARSANLVSPPYAFTSGQAHFTRMRPRPH